MSQTALELRVDVALDADADAVELDDAAGGLREELLELDVNDVQRLSDDAPPPGARAIAIPIVGALVVSAAKELIAAVVQTAAGWVARRPSASVTVTLGDDTIELTDASDEEQQRLIDLFVARHSATTS